METLNSHLFLVAHFSYEYNYIQLQLIQDGNIFFVWWIQGPVVGGLMGLLLLVLSQFLLQQAQLRVQLVEQLWQAYLK